MSPPVAYAKATQSPASVNFTESMLPLLCAVNRSACQTSPGYTPASDSACSNPAATSTVASPLSIRTTVGARSAPGR